MRQNEDYSPEDLRKLLREYDSKEIDMMEDTDETIEVYEAIKTLNDADKIILYLYAELGSLRAVGRTLGVSRSTARKAIMEVKNKLFEILDR